MQSENYQTIKAAMKNRQQIVCVYQDYEREICPHCIGNNKNGEEQMLGFQFAGGSSKGLPEGGQWRCLEISKLSNVRARDGEWYTGNSHTRPQTCVKDVDFEVNG